MDINKIRYSYKDLQDFTANKKHKPIKYGSALLNYMAEDSENKIESQNIKGLYNTKNGELKELLYRSDFKTELIKFGKHLSHTGDVAIVYVIIDGKPYIKFYEISSYVKKSPTELEELTIISNPNVKESSDKIYFRWFKNEDGKIVREEFLIGEDDKKIEQTQFIYEKANRVPGWIIRNNARSEADWVKVGEILQELDVMGDEIGSEWENIKTLWRNTSALGNGKNSEAFQNSLENGKRTLDSYGANAKFASQFSVMMSGSQTLQILISTIVFLEDRAMKYSFSGRDSDSSGTNKHNLQVGLFNQAHSEYVVKKKEQRERDLKIFFKEVIERELNIPTPNKIVIENSAYEQGKIDGMRIAQEQANLYKQQSKQQSANAKKTIEEAKIVGKRITTK